MHMTPKKERTHALLFLLPMIEEGGNLVASKKVVAPERDFLSLLKCTFCPSIMFSFFTVFFIKNPNKLLGGVSLTAG